jgi:hypothetical protein
MRRSGTQAIDRRCRLGAIPVGACMAIVSAAAVSSAATHNVAILLAINDDGRRVFELRGDNDDAIAAGGDKLKRLFAVYVVFDTEVADPPPLAGDYSVVEGAIRFTPKFPLQPGMRYRAIYHPSPGNERDPLSKEFLVPARAVGTATRVAAIYPSAATLPENQLKCYIHFSAPMCRGGAYEHLRLLDGAGKPVELPFLELAEELWNPAGDRLTLLLDPGRVKQELRPREEEGPILAAGRRYTLLVDRNWRDAAGQRLTADVRKSFEVTAADEICPDPKAWRLTLPPAVSQAPLSVRFGESLDHALLERMLWVVDDEGEQLPGDVDIGEGEARWMFRPQQPWQPGRYRLVADTLLEDLAGNSIARKFELDARRAVKPTTEEETVRVEFQISE